jgi:hypothetical protein
MAWFIVGSGQQDAYAFRARASGANWDAKLFDMTTRESLAVGVADKPGIKQGRWVSSSGSRTMLLALRVPRDCSAGTVEVHVVQKSSGREAVVEFSMNANAAGKGCYAV